MTDRRPSYAIAAIVVFTLSCGRPAPDAPAAVASPGARELLGGNPDFALSVRLDRLRVDPIYAPLIHESSLDKELANLFESVGSVDAVGAFDGDIVENTSFVGVLRAPPPFAQLPASWRKSIEEGGAGNKLPSGVYEYVSIDKRARPFGFYVTTSDFVLLMGHAAGPGHDWFSTHTSAPPPVEFGSDVLAGLWLGPHAMKTKAMAEWSKEPGTRGLESMTVLLRDGAHGDLVFTGTYATSDDAENAAQIAGKQMGMYASIWKSTRDKCPGISALTLETEKSGRTLRSRIAHIPEAIRAALACKW